MYLQTLLEQQESENLEVRTVENASKDGADNVHKLQQSKALSQKSINCINKVMFSDGLFICGLYLLFGLQYEFNYSTGAGHCSQLSLRL